MEIRSTKTKGESFQFRRQRPVLNYIADFICLELSLIIELDGFSHRTGEGVENDRLRDRNLIEKGFIVLRFDDEEVLNHINDVKDRIEEVI